MQEIEGREGWHEYQARVLDPPFRLEVDRHPRVVKGVRDMLIELAILGVLDLASVAYPQRGSRVDLLWFLILRLEQDRDRDVIGVPTDDVTDSRWIHVVALIGSEMGTHDGAARGCAVILGNRELALAV